MRAWLMLALLCGALLTLSTGCSTHTAFTYPMDPIKSINTNPPKARIAVVPANDQRGNSNVGGTAMLYLIPLVPFGPINYERPEASTMFFSIGRFDAKVSEDLPKAIAQHMQQAGIAKTVFFDYGGNAENADYVLETDIRRATYHGRVISYGLSVYGPLLWIFGLPGGTSDVELQMDLRLKDHAGNVVWTDHIGDQFHLTQGLYYNMGRDMEGLSRTLQTGLDAVLRRHAMDIKSTVTTPAP